MNGSLSAKPVVLIADVDPHHCMVIRQALMACGFEILTTPSGLDALAIAARILPVIIVLEWVLDDISGVEVCRRIKKDIKMRQIPVIFVSGHTAENDRVTGFEVGATDYVSKPVSPRELACRCLAVFRRTVPPSARR